MGGRGSTSRGTGPQRLGEATERLVGEMERAGAAPSDVRRALRDRDAANEAALRSADERAMARMNERIASGEALRRAQAIDSLRRGRIEYEDDLVRVISPSGNVDYQGLQDYNPYKDDDWRYSERAGHYIMDTPMGEYRMGRV